MKYFPELYIFLKAPNKKYVIQLDMVTTGTRKCIIIIKGGARRRV